MTVARFMMLPLFADIFNHVVRCDVGWLSACAFAIVSSVFYAYTSVCIWLIHLSSVIILNAKNKYFFPHWLVQKRMQVVWRTIHVSMCVLHTSLWRNLIQTWTLYKNLVYIVRRVLFSGGTPTRFGFACTQLAWLFPAGVGSATLLSSAPATTSGMFVYVLADWLNTVNIAKSVSLAHFLSL